MAVPLPNRCLQPRTHAFGASAPLHSSAGRQIEGARAATFTALPWLALAGSHWDRRSSRFALATAARAMVGAAELPVEKTFVATTLEYRRRVGGSDSSFLGAMLTEV